MDGIYVQRTSYEMQFVDFERILPQETMRFLCRHQTENVSSHLEFSSIFCCFISWRTTETASL